MSELFPTLEPPPGGLTRLRAAIDQLERKRGQRWLLRAAWLLPVSAAVAALIAVASPRLRPQAPGTEAELTSDVSLAAGAWSEPPGALMDSSSLVAQRIETRDAKVVIYAVSPREGLEPR